QSSSECDEGGQQRQREDYEESYFALVHKLLVPDFQSKHRETQAPLSANPHIPSVSEPIRAHRREEGQIRRRKAALQQNHLRGMHWRTLKGAESKAYGTQPQRSQQRGRRLSPGHADAVQVAKSPQRHRPENDQSNKQRPGDTTQEVLSRKEFDGNADQQQVDRQREENIPGV